MTKAQETIKYYTDTIDKLCEEQSYEELWDFLGTGICDGMYCDRKVESCQKNCALFSAVHKFLAEPTNENLNEVKSFVCQIIHNRFGG